MDRKARAEMTGGREVRHLVSTGLELRSVDGGMGISGLASRTDTPYDMGWYDERIARGAFEETLKRNPDVQLLVNHDGLPLARTTITDGAGSLRLREDSEGLRFDATLDGDDPDVQRLATKVRSGLMDQCSFAFRVIRQKWTWVEDENAAEQKDQREIQEVSLDRGDVSVVNYGANPATAVSMRAMILGLTDDEIAELGADVIARFRRSLATEPPAPIEVPVVEETPQVHDLDFYRARAFALRSHR